MGLKRRPCFACSASASPRQLISSRLWCFHQSSNHAPDEATSTPPRPLYRLCSSEPVLQTNHQPLPITRLSAAGFTKREIESPLARCIQPYTKQTKPDLRNHHRSGNFRCALLRFEVLSVSDSADEAMLQSPHTIESIITRHERTRARP